MKLLTRWGKFNLVGAIGMAVQLTALGLIIRILPGHYLAATGAALELTVLHNFFWHVHITWRDRRATSPLLTQCLRFHSANGLVSLAGNLALTPLLYREARLPLLVANAIAILACSVANFLLSDRWAFGLGG